MTESQPLYSNLTPVRPLLPYFSPPRKDRLQLFGFCQTKAISRSCPPYVVTELHPTANTTTIVTLLSLHVREHISLSIYYF